MVDSTLLNILVLFILNIYPGLATSDVTTPQPCPKIDFTEKRKYIQLCGKFSNQDSWNECGKFNSYLARLESLQNMIFSNNETADEFWVGPESFRTPCSGQADNEYLSYNGLTLNKNKEDAQHAVLCEQDDPLTKQPVPEELSKKYSTAVCSSLSCYVKFEKNIHQSDSQECHKKQLETVKLKSWADLDFIRKELQDSTFNSECPKTSSSKRNKNKVTLICESSIQLPSKYQTTIVKRSEKKTSNTSSNSPKTKATIITKPGVTPLVTFTTNMNYSAMAPNDSDQFLTKTTATNLMSNTNSPKTSISPQITTPITTTATTTTTTATTPKKTTPTTTPTKTTPTPKTTASTTPTKTTLTTKTTATTTATTPTKTTPTTITTATTTSATTSTIATKTSGVSPLKFSPENLSTPSNIDSTTSSSSTSLSKQAKTKKKDGSTSSNSSSNNGTTSKFYECPNGKMWKTSNLSQRGECCFNSTVRSKLECMAISQQHKCPYTFYQKSTSTCQSFNQKTSKSTTTKQLDCVNDHCYTCVGKP